MTAEESALIFHVGRALWTSQIAIRGELLERMRHPQAGDLVIEISHMGPFDPDGVGRLISIEGADPHDRYIVAPLHEPGVSRGWQNATFIALPDRKRSEWLAHHSSAHTSQA
jgi:hypothetical protein